MFVTIGMIVLNESEFIQKNLTQHYPYADKIVIIEGADRIFPKDACTKDGLSLDDTAEIIRSFPDPDCKIEFIQHGWANGKAELRNEYAKRTPPGILLAIDADEFLDHESIRWVIKELSQFNELISLRVPQVHLWKDTSHIIRGCYYSIAHHRCFRVGGPIEYTGKDHNHPRSRGKPIAHYKTMEMPLQLVRADDGRVTAAKPFWLHYGFCRDPEYIRNKNAFYISRGEAKEYPETTRNRAAWFAEGCPEGCEILKWVGPFPEVMEQPHVS